ncbi:MAG: hypothetical protein HYX27_00375 [Acidobacteria bacterium]|nr:hypothetical protein [Acidobacteriota bacterium]
MKNPLYISVGLFLAACCLPALEWKQKDGMDVMLGLRALAVGWSGIFAGVLAWYANPIWGIGLFFGALRKRAPAIVIGFLAILIALTLFNDLDRELPADEGNVNKTSIQRLLPGAYVWLLSLAAAPIGAAFRKPG